MNNVVERFLKYRKFLRGGLIQKYQQGRWLTLKESTNRYNKNNDHYLDEIEKYSRLHGFNDMLIAAMIANAIHENQGSPLPAGNRVGLWLGDKRLAKYLGNTVLSNVLAFKQDYDHGKWYNTYDRNGWNPTYHKLFKTGQSIDDVTFGMIAGYERFNGSTNRKHPEVTSRIKTARAVYKLLLKGVKPSAMINTLDSEGNNLAQSTNIVPDLMISDESIDYDLV